ncbi:MAG: hypothetical protein ACE5FN_01885 [Leptospirillia bacterium]
MMKGKIAALTAISLVSMGDIAFALEKAHGNPAHHGPGWLSTFAAVCGFILAWFSVVAIYMMVSGKAGKYTE